MPRAASITVPDTTSKARLRLWIRLLRTTRYIESELRSRLRSEFGATLPRFDVLAALNRQPAGMMMSELSRFLMVSNGNVTPIIEHLVNTGLVVRNQRHGDRRSLIVKLTEKGVTRFNQLATAHESWVNELLGDLDKKEAEHVAGFFRLHLQLHSSSPPITGE